MSRFEKRLILGLVLAILLIAGLEASVPKPTDWSASYSLDHRKPYGTALVYDRLKDLFPEVRTVRQPVLDAAMLRIESVDISAAPVNHVYIDGRFGLDRAAMEQLLALVEYGDRVFIAAENFYDNLASSCSMAARSNPKRPSMYTWFTGAALMSTLSIRSMAASSTGWRTVRTSGNRSFNLSTTNAAP